MTLAAQGPRGDYSISGTVVNSVTGEPVKGARVMMMALPQADPATGVPGNAQESVVRAAMAGPSGGFTFAGLPAGHYLLGAQKPGFVESPADSAIRADNIDLSASVAGYIIRLSPLGVIEGKLAGQRGDPLGGISVMVFNTAVIEGLRHRSYAHIATTDDRGQFRVWDLPPGKFYVKAMGRAGGTSRYVGDEGVRYDSWEGFRPVYLGGSRDLDAAMPIAIGAGTHARADFTLAVEPTFKIRGTLENFVSDSNVTFQLLEGDPDANWSRASLDSTTGKFEIDGVLPGQYTLRATYGRRARGETAVTVNSGDVEGVSVSLAPAVTVTVVERVRGQSAGEEGASVNGSAVTGFCSTHLEAPGMNDNHTVSRTGDGKELIDGVFGGQYQVRIRCGNGYAVSAASGATDLLANPVLAVQPGVTPPPIEIVSKSGGGELHGKFVGSGHAQGSGVLLVPAFPASTGPVTTELFPLSESASDLDFDFRNLAPGDYVAYAFSGIHSVEYRNPSFLRNLAGGASVRIEDGKTTEITLTSLLK